ncbi:MAG: hypothetical protein AAFU65_12430 [Pseudomonadota bacterium]
MLKRALKLLHTLSAIGFAGGLAAYMLVLHGAPEISATAHYLVLREALASLANLVIVPSMVVAVTSGLLAMAFHFPFHEAPWVWAKALSGVLLFEASLMSIDAPAEQAVDAVANAINGEIDPATLGGLIHDEWVAMWTVLALAVANVVLAIWRPRFRFGRSDLDDANSEDTADESAAD